MPCPGLPRAGHKPHGPPHRPSQNTDAPWLPGPWKMEAPKMPHGSPIGHPPSTSDRCLIATAPWIPSRDRRPHAIGRHVPPPSADAPRKQPSISVTGRYTRKNRKNHYSQDLAMQLDSKTQGHLLYEHDFYAWTQEQSTYLRLGQFEHLDLVNLSEEIESLGKQQRQELRNRLGILLGHLLKWHYQPKRRSASWFATIREQRREILEHLQENPSLKPYLPEAITKGYQKGIDLFTAETGINYKKLPQSCPFSMTQIFTEELEFPEPQPNRKKSKGESDFEH